MVNTLLPVAMRRAASVVSFALLACSGAVAVRVLPDSPWLQVLAAESTGFGMASHDVQIDSYKVLGAPPVVWTELPSPLSLAPGLSVIVSGSVKGNPVVQQLVTAGLVPTNCTVDWESHCVVPIPAASSPLGVDTIVLTGEGKRGPIYALYEFADTILGVDPYWAYTDMRPAFIGAEGIEVAGTIAIGSPAFEYRAGFPNDEDIFANWEPSPLGDNVWSLEAYDRYYQMLLRAKASAVLVGTNPLPDNTAIALASRRGLTVMHHHYNLLGSCPYRWPLGSGGWNLDTDAQAMSVVWNASIAAQANLDVIWSIGLRGLNDYAYPCSSDADCSRQINNALANMSAWVREAQGPDARMVLYMWDEVLNYLESGLLHVPEGTKLIFGDQGAGMVHGSSLLGQYADGLYDHSAMYNSNANQLTEMIPVSRILSQVYDVFMKAAKSLFVFVLNTSDLKPAIMTSRAYFQLAYDPSAFYQRLAQSPSIISATHSSGRAVDLHDDPNAAALAYYTAFAETYYGLSGANAASVGAAWQQWFMAPLVFDGLADNYLARSIIEAGDAVADAAAVGTPIPGKTMAQLQDMQAKCNSTTMAAFQASSAAIATAFAAVPTARQDFYNSHAVVNVAHGLQGCTGALAIAAAGQAYAAGDKAGALGNATAAVSAMEALQAARRAAEFKQWHGFYFGDHLSDFHAARRSAIHLQSALQPQPVPGPPNTGAIWYEFEAYQTAFAANYPLMHYNATWNLAQYVRVHCAAPNVTTGNCVNTPSGGHWRRGNAESVEMLFGGAGGSHSGNVTIVYTTDGSVPGMPGTPNTFNYSSPLVLDALPGSPTDVTFKVRALVDGVLLDTIATGWWTTW